MNPIELPIVKRRRIRVMALAWGLLALGLLMSYISSYLDNQSVLLVEEFARIVGIQATDSLYLFFLLLYLAFIIPMLKTLFQQKLIFDGTLELSENSILIKDKNFVYQEDWQNLTGVAFELNAQKLENYQNVRGKNYIHIPTQKGKLKLEFHISNQSIFGEVLNFVSKIQED